MNAGINKKVFFNLFFLLFFSFYCLFAGENMPAPDFNLFDTSHKVFRLSKKKGNLVLLSFFDPYYPACLKQLDDLNSLQKYYINKKVIIAGILVNTKISEDNIKKMVKGKKICYKILYGTSRVIKEYDNIRVLPSCFLIDQKGSIVEINHGYWLPDELKSRIEKYLEKDNRETDPSLKEK